MRMISGLHGHGPGDAQPLVLAAGESQGRLVQPVLDFVPEGRPAQALLHRLVQRAAVADAGDPQAVGHVLVDRLGERRRLLEDHAHPAPQLDHVQRADRGSPRRPSRMLPVVRTSSIRSFMRFRQRSKVDLPQPEGPIRAVTWWRGKSMRDVGQGLRLAVVETEVRPPGRSGRRPLPLGGGRLPVVTAAALATTGADSVRDMDCRDHSRGGLVKGTRLSTSFAL